MKLLSSILFFFLSVFSYSQNFQPGYFITNDGEKIEGLIDNTEAIRNPESFKYKLSEGDQTKEKKIREVKAFEILETPYKFIRAIVNLDYSEDVPTKLDNMREPNFKLDTLFLKVSIEGKASLYSYTSSKVPIRFYYSLGETQFEPLIFKRYLVEGSKIGINNRYKQQLINNFECLSLTPKTVSNLRYTEKSLNGIFTKINICEKANFENYFVKRRKGEFNLFLKAGLNYSAINFVQKQPLLNGQTSASFLSPRLGIEIEYIFPFFNNVLSIVSYPSYQISKTSEQILIYKNEMLPSNPNAFAGERKELRIDFSRVILPIGVRSYYYQGENIDLFIEGDAVFNILTNPSGAFNHENFTSIATFEEATVSPNVDITTGLKYKKLSVEIVYSHNIKMKNNIFIAEIINPITLNLGYKIF